MSTTSSTQSQGRCRRSPNVPIQTVDLLLLSLPLSERVRRVCLRSCSLHTRTLKQLASFCAGLLELDLSDTRIQESEHTCMADDREAESITRPLFSRSLRSVSLRGATFPPSLLIDLWEMATVAHLERLDLRGIRPRWVDGRLQCRMQLQLLLSSCSDLRHLDISECSWLNDAVVVETLKRCSWRELRSLSVAK